MPRYHWRCSAGPDSHRASRRLRAYTGDELGVRRQDRHGVEFLERPCVRVERQRGDHAGQLVEQIDEAVVGRNDQVPRP
jgi:hypothetical protein